MDRSRCPACSATVRSDAQWCSLCYHDLRPPRPQPQPAVLRPAALTMPTSASSEAAAPAPAAAAVTGSPASAEAAGWPCTSCSAVVPLDHDACPHCGAAFLGHLAGDGGRHRSSADGGTNRFSRPVRLAAGVLVGILLAVLVPVLLALLG